ncbi:MAG: hypothetical protein R3B47_20555, partial [Bacteroidia bacterium]
MIAIQPYSQQVDGRDYPSLQHRCPEIPASPEFCRLQKPFLIYNTFLQIANNQPITNRYHKQSLFST